MLYVDITLIWSIQRQHYHDKCMQIGEWQTGGNILSKCKLTKNSLQSPLQYS